MYIERDDDIYIYALHVYLFLCMYLLHHNAYVMRSGVCLTLVRVILYRYIQKEIYVFCSR